MKFSLVIYRSFADNPDAQERTLAQDIAEGHAQQFGPFDSVTEARQAGEDRAADYYEVNHIDPVTQDVVTDYIEGLIAP